MLFFSPGHATIVVAIGIAIIAVEKTVFAAVSNSSSGLERFGGLFGTVVSASFLPLIGLLNLVILAGIRLALCGSSPRCTAASTTKPSRSASWPTAASSTGSSAAG